MFNKNFLAVAGINLFIMVAYYLLFVISSPYAKGQFGASESLAGLAAGGMVLGSMAGRFVSGRLYELWGYRKVLFLGLLWFVLTMALYFPVNGIWAFLAVRFLSGLGVGFTGTVTGALVAHIVPRHQLGAGISWFSMSAILAMAVGPFLGILMMRRGAWNSMFLLCLCLGVLCLFIALFIRAVVSTEESADREEETCDETGEPAPCGFRLSNYIDYRALPISLATVAVCQGYANVQTSLSFYTAELNLMSAAGYFFPVYAAAICLTRPFTGRIMDKRGENVVMYPALAALALGFAVLGQTQSGWMLLLSAVLIGMGFGNFHSLAQTIALKVTPRKRYAQATSTYYIFLDLGLGFGPWFFGKIIPHTGYRGLFDLLAVITLCCLPLYYLLHGRRASRQGTA